MEVVHEFKRTKLMAAPYNAWTVSTTPDPSWSRRLESEPLEWADQINLRIEDGMVKTDMYTPIISGGRSFPILTLDPEWWQEPYNGISEEIVTGSRLPYAVVVRAYMEEEAPSPIDPLVNYSPFTSKGWQGDHWLWEATGTAYAQQYYVSIPKIIISPVYANIGPSVRLEVEYFITDIEEPPPTYVSLYTNMHASLGEKCLDTPLSVESVVIDSIYLRAYDTYSYFWEEKYGMCVGGSIEFFPDSEIIEEYELPVDSVQVSINNEEWSTRLHVSGIPLPNGIYNWPNTSRILCVINTTVHLEDGRSGPMVIHATIPGGG